MNTSSWYSAPHAAAICKSSRKPQASRYGDAGRFRGFRIVAGHRRPGSARLPGDDQRSQYESGPMCASRKSMKTRTLLGRWRVGRYIAYTCCSTGMNARPQRRSRLRSGLKFAGTRRPRLKPLGRPRPRGIAPPGPVASCDDPGRGLLAVGETARHERRHGNDPGVVAFFAASGERPRQAPTSLDIIPLSSTGRPYVKLSIRTKSSHSTRTLYGSST